MKAVTIYCLRKYQWEWMWCEWSCCVTQECTMDVPTVNWSTIQCVHHSSHLTHLTISELTLSIFERSSKQNTLHLIFQLDNYFTVKWMPMSLQLTQAKRFIRDPASTSWQTVRTVMTNTCTYDEPKTKFTAPKKFVLVAASVCIEAKNGMALWRVIFWDTPG
jgi:hypothetical protein